MRQMLRRDAGATVAHRQGLAAALDIAPNLHASAARRVRDGIIQQHAHDLPQLERITLDQQGALHVCFEQLSFRLGKVVRAVYARLSAR